MWYLILDFEIGRYSQYNHTDNREDYKEPVVLRACFKCGRKKQKAGANHAQPEPELVCQRVVGGTD